MHAYIVGTTGSGKSHLAREICKGVRDSGYQTLVLDPIGDPKWNEAADLVVTDKDHFLEIFWESTNLRVFCDELLRYTDNHDRDFHTTATMGRHNGHQVFYIAQRPSHVPINIRSQCQTVFTFKQNRKEAMLMAGDFGNDDLQQAARLGQYEFLHADAFKCVRTKL